MDAFTNSGKYKTYYFGVPENIIDSDSIMVYYPKDSSGNLSLSNLYEAIDSKFSGKYQDQSGCTGKLYDLDPSRKYYEIDSNSRKIEFNHIIYFSEGIPVGFTRFSTLQSTKIDEDDSRVKLIRIYIEFSLSQVESLEDELSIQFILSLSSLGSSVNLTESFGDSILERRFDRETPYKYTFYKELTNYIEKDTSDHNYLRYTNFLGDLISDKSYSSLTDCSILSQDNLGDIFSYKLSLCKGQKVNTFDLDFTDFFIGNYFGTLSLYEWDSVTWSYRVFSLSEMTRFGNPKVLVPTSSVKELFTEKERSQYSLKKITGNYLIFLNKETGEQVLIRLNDGFRENTIPSNIGVLIDPWDSKETNLIYYDKSIKDPKKLFNQDQDIYKDLMSISMNLSSYKSLTLEEKIGPWFVFSSVVSSKKPKKLIYASANGSLLVTEEEKILPINNRCILSQSQKGDGMNYNFYFISGGKTIQSDLYYTTYNDYLPPFEVREEYEISLGSSEILDEDFSGYRRMLIDSLRRNRILNYNLPNSPGFIASYSGILFYLDNPEDVKDKKLYYL